MNSATINTKSLRSVLSVCEKTTKRTPHPALRNVAISLNGSAVIRWTDKEQTLSVSIPCEHTGDDFSVLLNSVSLLSAIKGDRSGTVTLFSDGAIECDSTRQTVGYIEESDAIDRPVAPRIPGERIDTESVSIADFRDALEKTLYAADPDSSRYALGSVLIESSTDGLKFISTDSRRLVIASIRRFKKCDNPGDFETLLPMSCAESVLKLLPKTGEMTISENGTGGILIAWDKGTYRCASMCGRFPRYREVFPHSHDLEFTFCVSEALKAIKQLTPFVDAENRGVDLVPSRSRGEMIVAAGVPGNQTSRSFKIQGLDIETTHTSTYDLRYLVQYLESLSKKSSVKIKLLNDGQPCRMTCENTDTLIMPLSRDR